MALPIPPARLREAIAETMWEAVSAHDLAHACDALGMPDGTPGIRPMESKRRYVRDRLMKLRGPDLIEMVRRVAEEYGDPELAAVIGPRGVHGVDGHMKNLIFAAHGVKPRIVLRDAINNVIEIVEHADKCLVYDRPLEAAGLRWADLVEWWEESHPEAAEPEPARSLYRRLRDSLDSEVERLLFNTYGERYATEGDSAPALLPQIYLHYDPYTVRELASRDGQVLKRQRMDFLLLLDDRTRVVIEVDGKHHYADGDVASPRRYAEMVAEDRELRLSGYEVFRFGGLELNAEPAQRLVRDFFDRLLRRHKTA